VLELESARANRPLPGYEPPLIEDEDEFEDEYD
jgi:hypothetical protein